MGSMASLELRTQMVGPKPLLQTRLLFRLLRPMTGLEPLQARLLLRLLQARLPILVAQASLARS